MTKQIWKSFFLWALFAAMLIGAGDAQAQDENIEQQLMQQDQRLWLMEKLKNAKPAPTYPGVPYSEEETRSPRQNAIVERDLSTGLETVSPPRLPPQDQLEMPPFKGAPPPGSAEGERSADPDKDAFNRKSWVSPERLDGEQTDIVPEATPPGLLLNTTSYPFNTVYKMMMEFYSSTDGENYYYVCSGWSTGAFHVATAGHCVYNHDPNNDGNFSDASWATRVWAWAAQTDRVDPFGVGDFPYGVAMPNYLRSYVGWTNDGNFDHDWAIVTLDRRQGDHSGWMGREASVTTSSLNFSGYPTETPYVPEGTLGQYFGLGDVVGYTGGRIQLDAFVYGGHSGGPSWRFDGTDRWVQGIHSTSDRAGNAEDTLLTSGKLSDIAAWMSEDAVARPPVPRPNLIEYWFDTGAKDILDNNVAPGGGVTIEYNVLNAGFSTASNVRLEFYLSTNDYISAYDIHLGSDVYDSLADWSFENSTSTFTVPATTPLGVYYAGWLLTTDTAEYNMDDNQVVITSEQVTVSAASCAPDVFEPDDSDSEASSIAHNSNQTHNICPADDEDWLTFTLADDSGVVLETTGVSGDTRMWLYDAGIGEIEFNDDGGSGFFSRIDRECGVDHLAAGTYYVKVDEYGNDEEIESYNISLAVTACGNQEPDIRVVPLSLTFDESAGDLLKQSEGDIPEITDRTVYFKRSPVNTAYTENRADKPRSDITDRRHMLMQFDRLPAAEERAMLSESGIHLLSYLPNQTFWAGVDNHVDFAAVKAAGGVKWVWVPNSIYKTSRRIDAGSFPPDTKHGDGTVTVQVLLFEDVDNLEARKIIDGLAGGVRVVRPLGGKILEVRSPVTRIHEIADLDAVRWVEPANPPRVEENVTAAARVNADVLRGAPYNVDGAPLTVGVWDGGAVDAHPDFGSRLTVVDLVGVGDHGTHVAGTIGGSGVGDAAAIGTAPAVQLRSYDWNSDTSEMRTAATSDAVVISNHSYGFGTGWTWDGSTWVDHGDTGFGLYDINAHDYDDVVFDTGLLVFKSAGNDRNDGPDCPTECDGPYDSVGYVGNAKNILTIGALTDTDGMTGFSSWGPSDDGRIKPDLCANGTDLWSTLPANSYGSMSGTSMASPSAAGTAALIYEHFQNISGTDPSAALMKTLMIHGAGDLGAGGPDYQYGWGIIDAQVSADLISAGAYVESVITGTGNQNEFNFEVTGGDVKITLGWTDPAGDPAAGKALVNDLNLVLISPGGTEYHPWILDPANPAAVAGTGTNDTDNIEQVSIESPETGTWIARVSGFAVPFGPQAFALVGNGLAAGYRKILTIHNDGNALLSVSGVVPETAAPWINITPTIFDVPAGESRPVQVEVEFDQAPAGTSTVGLLIYSNDPDENPYSGVDVTVITSACEGDFNGDGVVNISDLIILIADFGRTNCATGLPCEGDFDDDGDVDGSNFAVFRTNFGKSNCP